MKNKTRAIVVLAVAAFLAVFAVQTASATDKITICHAAGQEGTTQFVTLELPEEAVYGQGGHFNENGTPQAGHEEDYLGPCQTPTTSPTTTTTIQPEEPTTTSTPSTSTSTTESPTTSSTASSTTLATSVSSSTLPAEPVVPDITTTTVQLNRLPKTGTDEALKMLPYAMITLCGGGIVILLARRPN